MTVYLSTGTILIFFSLQDHKITHKIIKKLFGIQNNIQFRVLNLKMSLYSLKIKKKKKFILGSPKLCQNNIKIILNSKILLNVVF